MLWNACGRRVSNSVGRIVLGGLSRVLGGVGQQVPRDGVGRVSGGSCIGRCGAGCVDRVSGDVGHVSGLSVSRGVGLVSGGVFRVLGGLGWVVRCALDASQGLGMHGNATTGKHARCNSTLFIETLRQRSKQGAIRPCEARDLTEKHVAATAPSEMVQDAVDEGEHVGRADTPRGVGCGPHGTHIHGQMDGQKKHAGGARCASQDRRRAGMRAAHL
eukprot:364314-Chlamydomonas_euryale.AAC.4